MHVGNQHITPIYSAGLRVGKLLVSVLLSAITLLVILTLLVNLWIRGWIVDDTSDYSLKQRLINNSLTSISYQQGSLQWYYFTPQIQLKQLNVKSQAAGLSSREVHLTIDLWKSLQYGSPIIQELLLLDNVVEIHQQQTNKALDLQWLSNMLLEAKYWQFKDTRLNWVNDKGVAEIMTDATLLRIENSDNFHRLIVNSGESSIIAELENNKALENENQLNAFQGQIYLRIEDHHLDIIFAMLGMDEAQFKGSVIESWIELSEQFNFSGYARLDLSGLINNKHAFKLPIKQLDFQYSPSEFYLSLPQMINLSDISARVVDYLSVAQIKNTSGSSSGNLLGVANKIKSLNVQGDVSDLYINATMNRGQKPKLLVSGRLNQVSINAVKNIPGLTNINGEFGLQPSQGFINLDSEDVKIDLNRNYQEAKTIDRVKGKLYWEIKQHNNQISVYTDTLDVRYKGQSGHFQMELLTPIVPPAIKETAKPYHQLTLKIGLQQLSLNHLNNIVPLQVSEQVRAFIDSALLIESNQNKYLHNLGLVLHEIKSDDFHSSVQIEGDANNLDIKFLQDWPKAESLTASVTINNGRVEALIDEGIFMGADLLSSKVQIENNDRLDLNIIGLIKGEGNQLLDMLRQTPLRNNVGNQLDSIVLNGDVSVNINYAMPLAKVSKQVFQQSQQVNITARLDNNTLVLQEASLDIEHLKGDFFYQLAEGESKFHSDKLTAELWQQKLNMQVGSSSDTVMIDVQSMFDTQTLKREFDLNLSEFIRGKTAVSGQVRLPLAENKPQQFNFTSVGEGISVDLPLGFGKSSSDSSSIDIQIINQPKHQQLNIDYKSPEGALLHSLFDYDVNEQRDASLKAIAVDLYQHDSHTITPSFSINGLNINNGFLNLQGHLNNADQETMMTLIQRFTELSEPDEKVAANQHLVAGLQPVINLTFDDFQLGDDFTMTNVGVNVTSNSQSWVVDFTQDLIDGTLHFYHDDREPFAHFNQIDIQRLLQFSDETVSDIANSSDNHKSGDKFANVQPHLLPSVTIQIDQLKNSNTQLGSLTFDMVSTSNGMLFDNINSSLFEQKNRTDHAEPNQIEWTFIGNQHNTTMNIDFVSKPLPNIINILLEQDIITSELLTLKGQLNWQGSPAGLSVDRLNGDLSFQLKNGAFNEIPASTNLLARLISLINLDNWSKRLLLDFSDVTSKGTAFDKITGSLILNEGNITIVDAIKAKLPASKIELTGSTNIVDDSVDAEVSLKLPIVQNTAWLAGFLINLPAAAGLYLISKLFSDEIENLTDITYSVDGKLSEPNIKLKGVKKNKSS